jgi:hypothetical protein
MNNFDFFFFTTTSKVLCNKITIAKQRRKEDAYKEAGACD